MAPDSCAVALLVRSERRKRLKKALGPQRPFKFGCCGNKQVQVQVRNEAWDLRRKGARGFLRGSPPDPTAVARLARSAGADLRRVVPKCAEVCGAYEERARVFFQARVGAQVGPPGGR